MADERAAAGSEFEWIRVGTAPRGYPEVVADLVPSRFDSYARVLHPIKLPQLGWSSWGAAAARKGVALTSHTQLPDILDRPQSTQGSSLVGEVAHYLPRAEWHAIGSILRRHSQTDSFVVGFWEGKTYPAIAEGHELLELPNRRYYVVQIPMTEWHDTRTVVDSSPNLVWASDASWFLNSDIDCACTYIGGSGELVDDLLADDSLESLAANLDDPVFLS